MNILNARYSVFDSRLDKMIEVPPLDEALEGIRLRMIRLQKANDELAEKNAKFKSGEWATEQVQNALEEAKRIRAEYQMGFPMTKEEVDTACKWIKQHDELHKNDKPSAIGGRYTYEFTPTSIGVFSSVRCSCGATCNLTDYSKM